MGWLEFCYVYKEKKVKGFVFDVGFFMYFVLMFVDIFVYDVNVVLVGED